MKKKNKMYFNEQVAKLFAEREQNKKNFHVSAIIDICAMWETREMKTPLHAADLGGGAHPDRYHALFERLLQNNNSIIDWVDESPIMLDLAKQYIDTEEYKNRKNVIHFIEEDMVQYVESLEDDTLDIAIMKYTFDYIENVQEFLNKLYKKLKKPGVCIATLSTISPELESMRTNARNLYKGEEFPAHETRTLKEGEHYGIKFFKESNKPELGYIEGAQTEKVFYSEHTIRSAATKAGFEVFIGDWKEHIPKEERENEELDQDILILKK